MKKLLTNLAPLFILMIMLSVPVFSQEYDDIYFRKKDRVKVENVTNSTTSGLQAKKEGDVSETTFDKTTNPDYLAYNDTTTGIEEDIYFEEGYEHQNPSQAVDEYIENADVVVKHYYYGRPSTSYYSRFDDVFWGDPFLYQGTAFDPFYDSYYRSSAYYRPGWNISFRIGGGHPYYSGSRWGYNSYYQSYNYGYSWGSYYNSYYNYYDPFWCPPSYYNNYYNQNIIANYDYNSRGVTRGKRTSRSSIYNSGRVSSRSTSSRVTNNDSNSGRISSGRVASDSDSKVKTRKSGRVANSTSEGSNYSGFRRSSSTYTSRQNSNSTRSSTGTRYNENNNRSSNVRSSGTTNSRNSRSSGSTYSRGNSNSSKSSNSNNTRSRSNYNSSNRNNSSGSSYNRSSTGSNSRSTSGSTSYNRSSRSSSSGSSYNRSNSTRSSSGSSSYNRSSNSSSRSSSGSSRSSSNSSRKKKD